MPEKERGWTVQMDFVEDGRMEGQISIFDFLQRREINKKNEFLGEPCMYCDVEWCSLVCFIRRGYIWDPLNRFFKRTGSYFITF